MEAVTRLFKELLSASHYCPKADRTSTFFSKPKYKSGKYILSGISLNLQAASEGATPFISGTREQ